MADNQKAFGKIFINDNITSRKEARGVTRVFEKHTQGIIAAYESDVAVYSPVAGDYRHAQYIKATPRAVQVRGRTVRIKNLLSRLNDGLAARSVRKLKSKVIFCPYFSYLKSATPQVITVHDMIYELFPQYYDPNHPGTREILAQKKFCIENAATIIAVSENTAQDIIRVFPKISLDKIRVAPHGVDAFFFAAPGQSVTSLDKPYFLYVGHRGGYKNFLRLLIAFGRSGLAKDYDLHVISPTANPFSAAEIEQIGQYNLMNSVHLFTSISDVALREKYRRAYAFVYPSEYEGFGLPILEAMASQTLVISSNTSSMPEAGGDLPFYFDPLSEDAITHALTEASQLSSEGRQERIAAGLVHARSYTWERSQKVVVEALRPYVTPD